MKKKPAGICQKHKYQPINSCELLQVAINLILFFQHHPGPSATAVGMKGWPKLGGGNGALEEKEELIVAKK